MEPNPIQPWVTRSASQTSLDPVIEWVGYASKAAEQACRIAGVLTLWRDLNAREVTTADMADAITLADFYLTEAARLSDGAKVSAEIERAEALRKWLVVRWPEPDILLRDVMHDCPICALREGPKARAATALLVQYGWLVAHDPQTVVGGTPRKEVWRIVRPNIAVRSPCVFGRIGRGRHTPT
ncbi:MAG: DUF3987 domain-containing protein [Candidatus Saccharibacteria bacterium]|nr:DUF3987 domain-containing protein [Pseudorhodobacter sp.]